MAAVVKYSVLFLTTLILVFFESTAEPRVLCTGDHFHCLDGDCIPRSGYCNDNYECSDNSDESYCDIHDSIYYGYNCPENWNYCADMSRCYPSEWKCDRKQDCFDNSDETGCVYRIPCTGDHFRCVNGDCIPRSGYCNKNKECSDNTDEYYCDNNDDFTFCPENWNFCANLSRCYPSEWRCDKKQDCLDNSDEMDCGRHELLSISGVIQSHANLTKYFLKRRQPTRSLSKWGPHLPRTAMALFLADENFFASGNKTGEEISYEISMQLLSKLVLKKNISTQQLCLFVNALTVSCIDPKDFFGVNVVAELRSRVNGDNHTNPFTILTLCNAGDTMTTEDIVKLQQQFDAHHRPLWTDTQALATMALACISSRSNLTVDDRILKDMETELKRRQFKNGTIDNLKTTALVVQAMIATDSYRTEFDLESAVKYMLKEVKQKYAPINDLYYILPVLNFKSLVDINSKHCVTPIKTGKELEVLNKLRENPDARIQVQFSVYIGDDMDFVRTWKLKVPSSYTFYQLLENVGTLEPSYKVQYSVSEGKPYVSGLTNFYDEAEDEMFWFVYTQAIPSTSSSKMKLIEASPVDIQMKETEEVILWYRSKVWDDSSI